NEPMIAKNLQAHRPEMANVRAASPSRCPAKPLLANDVSPRPARSKTGMSFAAASKGGRRDGIGCMPGRGGLFE
ncbi:MAG: hypothetical protein ACJ8EN_11185, partial [Xanthobacteraceae bacterium]